MKRIVSLAKKEIVLFVAAILAIISMFFVVPDKVYIDYIDFRTLAILFCLMTVMAGLQKIGIFKWIAKILLDMAHTLWQLIMILTMLCFFFSMVITNDVALITFVPLTLTVIDMIEVEGRRSWVIPIVVMQTIAANLGSMMTPIGNPQNLYLYGKASMSVGDFMILMLPYTLVALVLLIGWSLVYCINRRIRLTVKLSDGNEKIQWTQFCVYLLLFIISLLVVARILSYLAVFVIVLVVVLFMDRDILKRVDYSLLLTFVAFFIFIGNMGRIPAFEIFLQGMISDHETITAVAASQVISNVPAALLLSGFTDRYRDLIVGTNLGGLGTLIASMASLISFKYIAKYDGMMRGKYFKYFTVANVIFLTIELIIFMII